MSSSFVFQGERGIGKTALAKLVKHIASTKDPKLYNLNFLTTYYSVEVGQDFKNVIQAALNSLTDQLPNPIIKRLGERLGAIFKDGKFSFGAFGVNLEVEKKGKPQGEIFLKDQIISILKNIIKGVEASEEKYDGMLIIIDEAQNISDISGVAQILRGIITTLNVEELGRISFLVIGYEEAIEKFFEGDPSAKRNFDTTTLTVMPLSEASEILKKGFDQIKVRYKPEEVEKFIIPTHGYPHSIQVLGHHLIENDTDNFIGEDDWNKAKWDAAIELQTKDFSHFYKFNKKPTIRERVLNYLAIASSEVTKTELDKKFKGKNIYQENCLGHLKKVGAIKEDKKTGVISLHSPLFRTAIFLNILANDLNKTDPILAEEFDKIYKNNEEQKEKPLDAP